MARRARRPGRSAPARDAVTTPVASSTKVAPTGLTTGALALVGGVALAVRAIHLWSLSASPFWTAMMGDAASYLEWARRIAGGDWLGTDAFYQAPLYPYFLAAILELSTGSLAAVRMVQIAVGAASCALLGWAAGRLFGAATGLAGGLILAVYPQAVFFDALVQKTVLDGVLLSGVIAVVALIAISASLVRAVGLGAVLGLLALTRENALVGIPVVTWWLWRRGAGWPQAAAAVLGAAIVLLPVGARNLALGGRFQPTTSQFGPNLYIGNSETATGLYVPLRPGHGSAEFERRDATALAEAAVGRPLRPGEVSDHWRDRAVAWAVAHPGDWLRLFGKKLLLTWNAEEAADTEDVATHAEWSPVLRLRRVVHFGVLAPLGLLGMWIHRTRARELGVLYLLVPAYTAAVAAFYVFDRYRFPLVPLLVVFAAAALTGAAAWWRRSTSTERIGGAVVAAVAAVACNWPLLSPASMQAATAFNLGVHLSDAGRPDDAAAAYRRAIALLPAHARARANLGALLTRRGDHDEALAQLREAVRLEPALPSALTNLGIALSAIHQPEEAIVVLRRALELDPSNVETRYNLGVATATVGDRRRALGYFQDVIAAEPSHALAHNNAGALLAMEGDLRSALAHFTTAAELDPSNADFARNRDRARAALAGAAASSGGSGVPDTR